MISLLIAATVTLAWNASEGATGYKVYFGTAPGVYAASNVVTDTRATVERLIPGTRYYFAATAHNADGLESDYSAEINYLVPEYTITATVQSSDAIDGPWDTIWTQTIPVSGEKPMRFIRSILKIEPKQ